MKLKYFLLLFIITPELGLCYIDPGSLSAIWQFLAAILIGLLSGISFIRVKLLKYSILFSKKTKKEIVLILIK